MNGSCGVVSSSRTNSE